MPDKYAYLSEIKKKLSVPKLDDRQTGYPNTAAIGSGSARLGASAHGSLNNAQIEEAALVKKLPPDFPIEQWDAMPTKAQLLAMRYSGLKEQEQWTLLNASTPLGTLSMLNDIQSGLAAHKFSTKEAALLTDSVTRLAAERKRLESGDASRLPSLQKGVLRGQLNSRKDALRAMIETDAPSLVPNPINPYAPQPTPTPDNTPLPQPGPSPEISSTDEQHIAEQDNDSDSNGANQEKPGKILLGIDTTYLSTGSRKILELINRKIANKALTPELFKTYLLDLSKIKTEAEKGEYIEKIKASSLPEATWGTEMINNQSVYSKAFATFGGLGNIAGNACGVIAIHNANQILGYNTEFEDLMYQMQKYSLMSTNAFGLLGMNPDVIGGIYSKAGAKVTMYFNPKDVPTDHDGYIAMFSYPIGAHYVAADFNKEKGTFDVYNLDDDGVKKQLNDLSRKSYPGTFLWIVWGIDMPNEPDIGKTGPMFKMQK
ncbi:MAG: hypothetical protein GX417_02660 [Clostridiales bacterium]|nr:hypothetical protein [Clostridiales bacterium]